MVERIQPGDRKRRRDRCRRDSWEPRRYAGDPPSVWVTGHATNRMWERFGKVLPIPDRLIQKVGLSKPVGKEYHIRRRDAVFVCKRLQTSVAVKTVLVHGAVVGANGVLIRST
jgi:hypothetical protein